MTGTPTVRGDPPWGASPTMRLVVHAVGVLLFAITAGACQRHPSPVEAMCSALSDMKSALDDVAAIDPAATVAARHNVEAATKAADAREAQDALATALASIEKAAPGPWCCALPIEVPWRVRAIQAAAARYDSTLADVRSDPSPDVRAREVSAREVLSATVGIRSAVDDLDHVLSCGSVLSE